MDGHSLKGLVGFGGSFLTASHIDTDGLKTRQESWRERVKHSTLDQQSTTTTFYKIVHHLLSVFEP